MAFQNFFQTHYRRIALGTFFGAGGKQSSDSGKSSRSKQSRLLRKSGSKATKLLHANAQSFKSDTRMSVVVIVWRLKSDPSE